MRRIGFTGLGHMGLPMAINLLKAGHTVTGFDLQQAPLKALVKAGGIAATSLREASSDQEIFITMLQTGQQVKQVCLGREGLYAAAKPQALHIDCSSIDVASSRFIHEEAGKYLLQSLDTPVSGGTAGAQQGTLTFMVGGEKSSLELARPILSLMGKTIIHTGAPGNGQAAKICNNMILGISMIAISEAFVLARKLGLPDQKLFEVVNNASGQCWAMSHYVPVPAILPEVPANHSWEPGFTAAMMLKDLLLSQAAALSTGVDTPMGKEAARLYQEFNDLGLGNLDFSAVKMIER